MMNLASILEQQSQRQGAGIALIYENSRYSYDELNRAVDALGLHFLRLGIRKGDRIALFLPNCPEFILAYFAGVKIGAVVVTASSLSTSYELEHILADSEAKVLVTRAGMAKRYEDIQTPLPSLRQVLLVDDKEGGCTFSALLEQPRGDLPPAEVEDDDPAVMIYTAGLTGRPLGAVLTHGNLLSQSTLVQDVIMGTEADRCLAVIPLFHSFGAAVNMVSSLRAGAGIVLMERFTMETIFSTLERERVTFIAAVPRLYLGMIFHEGGEKYDLSSLRVCITGGSAMPPQFIPIFKDKFGVKLLEGYGLTEAAPVCAASRPWMVQKLGSIGIPVNGVKVKIVNDRGETLPPGERGELLVSGPNVMKGYHKDEAATARVIRDGWLYTGDVGYIDEDGYIFLTGRKKRMIITSGFNVYPREVEAVLELHPSVAQAMAVGKEDLLRGEVVKALVLVKEGAQMDEREVLKHCRTYLSPYKVPREVEFVRTLPPIL